MNRKQKTSYLWSYFTTTDPVSKIARCDLCGQLASFKTTVSNLRKHLERKHTTVALPPPGGKHLPVSNVVEPLAVPSLASTLNRTTSNTNIAMQNVNSDNIATNSSMCNIVPNNQPSIRSFIPQQKKISETQKKKLDKLLLNVFVQDYQPFSVVEDEGFKKFVNGLNPNYVLPNRKTISSSMIPAEYEMCLNAVRQEMLTVSNVTLTTDTWTSSNTESYMALTSHHISNDFELKSILLECSVIRSSHTSVNLAVEIDKIVKKFHLEGKIMIIVSDNASNIVGAITNELKLKHFGCFAHTINLILQDALKVCQSLTDRIKAIWLLINKEIPVLTEDEWKTCSELVMVLEPFEEVTRNISGENYLTASQVIGFINGLVSVCNKMRKETLSEVSKRVVDELLKGLKTRFSNIENSKTIALATLLDPRFKLAVFSDEKSAGSIKTYCTELMSAIWSKKTSTSVTSVSGSQEKDDGNQPLTKQAKFSIWADLDKMIASKKPSGSKTSAAIVEMNRYLDEECIGRSENPLLWWKQNEVFYPLLSQVVKKTFLCSGNIGPLPVLPANLPSTMAKVSVTAAAVNYPVVKKDSDYLLSLKECVTYGCLKGNHEVQRRSSLAKAALLSRKEIVLFEEPD
ncbi:zinc finger BED domain-containing protein 4-like [Homalodisca vitripennis]|uniref:zinc finger BED domain-containing protein 4-like n=1 Tax=Homalodisca vitripennis TaxID=197043 RepID=UPI001EEC875A|nr:zinc finger BED domain-containing protein 4-like [Homalodisca vitripennis]